MKNHKNQYIRLFALAEEVVRVDDRLSAYKNADDSHEPSSQLMIRQYTRLRRERYADYLQEFFSLHLHQKGFLPVLQELSTRILSDETESADIPEVRKTFEMLLKAS